LLLNTLYEQGKRFDELTPLFAELAAHQNAWEVASDFCRDLPLRGFWPVCHRHLMLQASGGNDGWFAQRLEKDIQLPNALAEMGWPLTVDPTHSVAALIGGEVARGLTDEELQRLLAGGLLIDVSTLRILEGRGLGELAGVRTGQRAGHCYETFTEHFFNGTYAGDGRRAFPNATATGLEIIDPGVMVLSEAFRQEDDSRLGNCLTAFENSLGGRIAVASYAPWEQLGRVGKRTQLLRLASWLCRGDMPLEIESPVRVIPLIRGDGETGRVMVTLLHTALGDSGDFVVRLPLQATRVTLLSGSSRRSLAMAVTKRDTRMMIPSMKANSSAILLIETSDQSE